MSKLKEHLPWLLSGIIPATLVFIGTIVYYKYYHVNPNLKCSTEVFLDGEWEIVAVIENGTKKVGSVYIAQERNSCLFKMDGSIESVIKGDPHIITFWSEIGQIKADNSIWMIFGNSKFERGVINGSFSDIQPNQMTLDYRDLIGMDFTKDKFGQLQLVRK